ncbi:MAG: WecB/TagA/CpsF family glycosyltransferase [Oscillospiraceae bacterium]|nr:WecB/TagA/CpsF family glycosyltransferase [Oscillospiraceae bacterium]
MSDINKVNVRGVNFSNVTMDETVDIAKKFICSAGVHVIYTPNAEIVQDCIDDKTGDLFKIINSADMVIPDGAGVVLVSKILKIPLKQKVAGIELAYRLLDYLNEAGGILFLLGSTQENVELAAKNINERYGNIKVFFNNGYFTKEKDSEENNSVIQKINGCAPDVIFVCFGAPPSEKWICANKDKLNAKLLIGLGGTIDVIAGVKKYAPQIFIKLNLEWLYYYIKYPARRKRFKALPKFVFGSMFAKKKNNY